VNDSNEVLTEGTERANSAIRSSEHRVQRVLDNLFAFVGVLTRDGTLIEANRAPLEAAGIAPSEVIGKRFWDCFWWSYSAELQERIKTAVARALEGEASRFDAEIRVIDDQRMIIDFMLSPLRETSGEIVELIASAVDVTERCRAENALHALNERLERTVEERTAALRASEQRFRLAMQNSPIGLAIVGLDGRFLEVNKALCEILGYEAAELLACTFQDITHPDDLNADLDLLGQLVAGKVPTYQMEKRYSHKQGHLVWSQLNVSLVRGDDDAPLYFISKIQDITERKQISSAMEAVSSELIAYEGEAYFQHAVTRAAEIISADIAFISRYDADDPETVVTLVLVEAGVVGDSLRYRLKDTPCAEVLATGQGLMLNEGLQSRYPRDRFFVDKAINAYAATPLTDTKGNLLGHFCVMRHEPFVHVEAVSQVLNLFSLAAATQLVRERNWRQYQDLFEFAPDALVMSTPDGRLVMANRQAERLFGYGQASLLEQRIEQLLPGASWAQEAALEQGSAAGPERQRVAQETLSLKAHHRNGTTRPVEVSYTRLQTESGARLALAIRDVSERVESNTRLLAMADTLPVLLTYFDRDGLCRMANRTFERWFQCRADAVLGQSREALLGAFAGKGYLECAEAGTGAASRSAFEAVHRYPDGEERNVEVHYVPHLDAQGGVIGYYTMVVDITERVRIGKQLALSQKMDSIGRLSGGVAHDFNNLLSVIQGNLQLLERSAAKGDIEAMSTWIGAALDAVSKGADLTQRLLAFSRRQDFADEVIDVKRRLAEIDSLLQRIIGEEIALRTRIGERLLPILGDVSQFDNALINLAVNARDAMPQGGTLTIEADTIYLNSRYVSAHPNLPAGDYLLITVSDTGQGVAPEHVDRVFEPFFTTKGPDKGTGLGLASVYGFMKQAKGHVTLYSEVGHGTSVNLYFPVRDLGAKVARAEQRDAASESVESTPLQGKVLVVDDHADVRMLSAEMLRSFGCTVLEASDGPSALRILAEHPDIDLLFTDVVMPGGMNGLELAQRAVAASPGLRVLYTSGFTEASAAHNTPRVEHSLWLRKPVDIAVLEREIRHILQPDAASEAPPT